MFSGLYYIYVHFKSTSHTHTSTTPSSSSSSSSTPFLCLPHSVMVTGKTTVLTLMSPSLTALLRFSPTLFWFTPPPVGDWEEGQKSERRGIHCSLSPSTVSLYLWHLQPDWGRSLTLGRMWTTSDGHPADWLQDSSPPTPKPQITLGEVPEWVRGPQQTGAQVYL